MMLSNIRTVLIETSHPGNIGAAARAMKTMYLETLYLVSPKNYPCADATVRASGADDVLIGAQVVDSFNDAISDCSLVIGASARPRRITWPEITPAECANLVVSEARSSKVAIVFGREDSGLTNLEMDRCHYLMRIPTNPDFSSLNLGAAVQILAYEILKASQLGEPSHDDNCENELVTAKELESLYGHFEQVLVEIEFVSADSPKHLKRLMRRIRRLFNRARMDKDELNILRGVLTAVQASNQFAGSDGGKTDESPQWPINPASDNRC